MNHSGAVALARQGADPHPASLAPLVGRGEAEDQGKPRVL
eukprot:CAMPEP_0170389374 /NCGR_PEP_ID=MMETSP0117_2-20130122/18582_1 /TAXON_ID=400756 /ORGANISM="Durinskia baltica, Strain CSIRO CS-38" /LENGTH=39 /DNA_ID= /DNA_START= /DNA_END= /DNA_ORIENTATION=